MEHMAAQSDVWLNFYCVALFTGKVLRFTLWYYFLVWFGILASTSVIYVITGKNYLNSFWNNLLEPLVEMTYNFIIGTEQGFI